MLIRKWFEPRSNNLIENDHLGDWSPEKDCCWRLTTCAKSIFRVKLILKVASAQEGTHSLLLSGKKLASSFKQSTLRTT